MRWEQFFWIVYGIGSTLFVFFLFKLGNAVAGSREESVRREIGQPREPDQMPAVAGRDATGPLQERAGQSPAGRAVGVGDKNAGEAVATAIATNGIVPIAGGFHAGSGVHRHVDQGRNVAAVRSR